MRWLVLAALLCAPSVVSGQQGVIYLPQTSYVPYQRVGVLIRQRLRPTLFGLNRALYGPYQTVVHPVYAPVRRQANSRNTQPPQPARQPIHRHDVEPFRGIGVNVNIQ